MAIWHNLTAVYDTDKIHSDVNDSEVGTGVAYVGTYAPKEIGMEIGAFAGSSALPLLGVASNASAYNRALSASEIQQLYRTPDLPLQQQPTWMGKSPAVVGANQIPMHLFSRVA